MSDIAKTYHRAYHDSGIRYDDPIWIIIHCTQSDTAKETALYFANPKSKGSAHVIVDDNESYRCLRDNIIPWAAPGANQRGWHIEFTGYANWSRERWMNHNLMLRRGAYQCALRAHRYNIPLRWRNRFGLRLGRPGFSDHNTCSKAFGGDHTDPGPGFPIDYFLQLVGEYKIELDQKGM